MYTTGAQLKRSQQDMLPATLYCTSDRLRGAYSAFAQYQECTACFAIKNKTPAQVKVGRTLSAAHLASQTARSISRQQSHYAIRI